MTPDQCAVIFAQPRRNRTRREELCTTLAGLCAPPRSDCVTLATIPLTKDGHGEINPCSYRGTVYSNAVLLDLILCLAARVDRCCGPEGPPPHVDLPVVNAIWPMNGAELLLAQLGQPRLEITFNHEMNPAQLRVPKDWLRAFLLVEGLREGVSVAPIPLAYDRRLGDAEKTIPEPGFAERFLFKQSKPVAELMQSALHAPVGVRPIQVLVQIRAPAAGPVPADTGTPPVILDADFGGTKLTQQELDATWGITALGPWPGNPAHLAPQTPAPQLPSGSGDAGGEFHSIFQLVRGG